MHEVLLNVASKELRYAYLRHGQLSDLIIDRSATRQITGNIYKGHVVNILHNIQSAFIDIGEETNGFVHISDILENTKKFEEMFEMDFDFKVDLSQGAPPKDISQVFKPDQAVLVQVVKEPIGSKGARLTSNISVAGRYLVLLPNSPHRGVSKKISAPAARDRLKQLIQSLELPKEIGIICRTASVQASDEALINEAHELYETWQSIIEKFQKSTKGSALLFEESDLVKRAVLAALDKGYDRLIIDDHATYQRCKQLVERYGNKQSRLQIEFYRDRTPLFDRFNVEREIERALRRKIWLSCGGYLFFDRTEAMHTIDVNSGRSHNSASGDLEEALLRINLEAVDEIARQLRLRNIGGLIICDFIDMRSRKNQRRVLDRLREAMENDSAKCTILGMSEFGLVEMTRQRNRESLSQMVFTPCPYCSGSGQIKSFETVAIEIERTLHHWLRTHSQGQLKLVSHPHLYRYLQEGDKGLFQKILRKASSQIDFSVDDNLHVSDYLLYSNGQLLNH